MDVRVKIDVLRRNRGWTRADLARKIGVSYTAVKNWYNEKNFYPSLRAVDDICNVFQITKAQLFSDIELDNLTEDQIGVLELYNRLSEEKKKVVIEILKVL